MEVFLNCKNAPMKKNEDIIVFSKGTIANKSKRLMKYYPQGLLEVNKPMKRYKNKDEGAIGNRPSREGEYTRKFENYPNNILTFDLDTKCIHPTQKPLKLIKYLINTYTDKSDIVLDNCMGSFTTAIACKDLNRDYIGFENDNIYYDLGQKRLELAHIN